MAESSDFATQFRIPTPPGGGCRSIEGPVFRRRAHGGHRTHDQVHVKTEAAGGGVRKASLYKGLVVGTQSPMRLMASRNRVAQPTAGIWSRFHLKRRRTKNLRFQENNSGAWMSLSTIWSLTPRRRTSTVRFRTGPASKTLDFCDGRSFQEPHPVAIHISAIEDWAEPEFGSD